MTNNIVHVVGTGTIGEPLIGLFAQFKDKWGISEVTFHKRTPAAEGRAMVNSLINRGARLVADEQARDDFARLGHRVSYTTEEALERATVVVDCTPAGNDNKAMYQRFKGPKGFLAQGSEFGFGKPYARGINDEVQSPDERFVQIVSCNTHNISVLLKTLACDKNGKLSLEAGRFVCMRRANDVSDTKSFIAAPQAGKHDDPDFGTHHARDAHRLFETVGEKLNLFSSAMKALTGQQFEDADGDQLPANYQLTLNKAADLRYGENPHQLAALYEIRNRQEQRQSGGVANSEQLAGKEMSFNNYVDADAAWQLVSDFDDLACAIIKHTNPAGAALGTSGDEAYRRALACDPISAFGGIVAFNNAVDQAAARAVTEIFVEVVVAPNYEPAALEILRTKKNLRVLRIDKENQDAGLEYRQVSGGMLVQTRDAHRLNREGLKVVTKRAPSDRELDDLLFAWTVCKHTKSNAIVYARDNQTVGVGAGQMSRVDAVKIGAMRAQLPLERSVMASDAFFPFRDGIDEAAKHGIVAVIQPGGSVRDQEVIAAADEHNLAMVFTGVRHFKH